MRPVTTLRPTPGDRFGRLIVLEEFEMRQTTRQYRCKCDCGKIRIVAIYNLTKGMTKSCGCFGREQRIKSRTTHGYAHTKIYGVWSAMHDRCYLKTCKAYRFYGGRGIKVCDRWRSFENFLADMGERPSSKHSIERRDNDGNYEPGNCSWELKKTQARNTRTNHQLRIGESVRAIAGWAELSGVPAVTLLMRVRRGWPVERLLLPAGARSGLARKAIREPRRFALTIGQTRAQTLSPEGDQRRCMTKHLPSAMESCTAND